MTGYLVRRFAALIPVALGVATLTFALIHLVPGDPVTAMLGDTERDRNECGEAADEIASHRAVLGAGASDTLASERRLPLGNGVKPFTRRFITATLFIHQSDT